MRVKIRQVRLDNCRRILVISDVHGKLACLKTLLEQVDFAPEDVLILLGDMVERGEDSLATLRYVMELCRQPRVYFVMGNCDALLLRLHPESRGMLNYLQDHPKSLICQMAQAGGFQITDERDLPAFADFLRQNFPQEIEFLEGSPTILETEFYVFVHGGVPSYDHMEQLDAWYCMKNDEFLKKNSCFSKYCVVGHWPTALYCEDIPCCNPIILSDRKIISIDGGCGVKAGGQLNALILPVHGGDNIAFQSCDDYPKGIALDPQTESVNPVTIRWTDNLIDIVTQGPEFSLCRQQSTGRTLWVPSSYLMTHDGKNYCEDITDYCLPVSPGDCLSIIEDTGRGYFAKRNGLIGWYHGRLEQDE